MLKIYIPKSKTDQLRKGDEVAIARSSAPTCPVKMLERYIHMAKIDKMDTELFSRRVSASELEAPLGTVHCGNYSKRR